MKIINHFMIAGAALLMLAGCSTDELSGNKEGQIPVRLSVSQQTATMRAADGLYTNTTGFDGNEQVEVYVNSNDKHATFTVGTPDGEHKSELTGTLYYPTSGDADLYAVYPATSTASHTVKYDQTTAANYKASDLMYAKNTVTQANKTSTQDLQFSHQLVKLKVVIIKAADVSQVTKVEMKNVKRKATVSLTSSALTLSELTSATDEEGTGANEDKILVFSGTYTETTAQTYAVVFPKQEWSDADFITVTADGKDATYKLTKDNFVAGSEYTLTLNINAAALDNTVSITNWTGPEGTVNVAPTVEKPFPGALSGKFSVSATTQVCFSQGNLRATTTDNGSSWTWSFAENQWDYIGNTGGNTMLEAASPFISGDGTVTVDLFGWVGASSTWTGVNMYGITSSNATGNKEGYGDNATESLRSDWGALPISNGGNSVYSGWRTLTSAEWTYLFNTRTTGGTVFGTNQARYAHATINTDGTSVNGMILFPDGVNIASSEVTTAGTVNGNSAFATKCTTAQWGKLAAKGCVFLPAAGYRNGTTVSNAGSNGRYWSSAAYPSDANYAYRVYFNSGNLNPADDYFRNYGFSVRLVRVP